MSKYLIITADDFGYTCGVNQGILEVHLSGVVSSASLMVDAPAALEAGELARKHTSLGVGLHFVATDRAGPLFDLNDLATVEKEIYRQYHRFCDLLGRWPTHLDSHEHVHLREKQLRPLFRTWAEEHRLPLRRAGRVHFNGGFYGERYDEEWRPHPAPELIGVDNLVRILRALPEGITELACHPGYITPDLDSSYAAEREIELSTLLDACIPALLRELEITLINFVALPNLSEVS